jgi:hypothetical protein
MSYLEVMIELFIYYLLGLISSWAILLDWYLMFSGPRVREKLSIFTSLSFFMGSTISIYSQRIDS